MLPHLKFSLRFNNLLLFFSTILALTVSAVSPSHAQFPGSPIGTVFKAIQVHQFWKEVYDAPGRLGLLVVKVHELYHGQHSYAGLSNDHLYNGTLFVRPPRGKQPEIEVFPGTVDAENDTIRFVIHKVSERRCEKLLRSSLLAGSFVQARVNGHAIELPYSTGCAERLKQDIAENYQHGEKTMELFFK